MNRRDFLKQAMAASFIGSAGQLFAATPLQLASGIDPASLELNAIIGDQLPRVIHIFLYGGASELAGNLTNIAQIRRESQNPYPDTLTTDHRDSQITPNGFWRSAGGEAMERMLAAGDMSIYRTIHRLKEDSKAHGPSVVQNLVGSLDMGRPGIAATLAKLIEYGQPFGKPVEEILFPLVTFEGDSPFFSLGGLPLNSALRPMALNAQLQNPYQRGNIKVNNLEFLFNGSAIDRALESLASQRNQSGPRRLAEAMAFRATYAERLSNLLTPAAVAQQIDDFNQTLPAEAQIAYPEHSFGALLKGAVALILANQETLVVSASATALGGWDDHSDALVDYPQRMQRLMEAIEMALRHLHAAHNAGVMHADNVVINVYSEFGRNVNLNNSQGWDHGNNQNLYTFGGWGLDDRELGKIIGTTEVYGSGQHNRLYTRPTAASIQYEPFAIASSLYRRFGLANSAILSGEEAIVGL
jgi:hypothetical protein